MRILLIALAVSLAAASAQAAPCTAESPDSALTGKNECLVLRSFTGAQVAGAPQALVVVLHGDVSGGGPANYHFAWAQQLVDVPELARAVAIAVVRPGYEDGAGARSGGSHNNRSDHYTASNIDEVAGVVAKLKQLHQPQRVVLLGHSGGAAMAAVKAGRHPGLVDGVVLVACPCHLADWRLSRNRSLWTLSESPHSWIDRIPLSTRIIALTGTGDDNTGPRLAQDYVKRARERGLNARFEAIDGASHNAAFRSPQVTAAVVELATR
ncbi:MAG: alpha/beta hydrolase family protein [Reyranellaceae bacterium]